MHPERIETLINYFSLLSYPKETVSAIEKSQISSSTEETIRILGLAIESWRGIIDIEETQYFEQVKSKSRYLEESEKLRLYLSAISFSETLLEFGPESLSHYTYEKDSEIFSKIHFNMHFKETPFTTMAPMVLP